MQLISINARRRTLPRINFKSTLEDRLNNTVAPSGPVGIQAVHAWIATKHGTKLSVDLDLDLIEHRLIDSLDFAEFLFFLEELIGRSIDLAEVDLDTFRTLRSIQTRFLSPVLQHG